MSGSELAIRRAEDGDIPAAIAVAAVALGWSPDEPNEAFFRWKHLENPAGASPMWIATNGATVAGFRTMMQWKFQDRSGAVLHAARAVDTATHPDHRRKGIFRTLTLAAVEELTAKGVRFVFNTPNDNSRPGYLRMGWQEAGRIPTRFALTSAGALVRVARARTSAAKWSEVLQTGDPIDRAADDLADLAAEVLPKTTPTTTELLTVRSSDHLRWRYGFAPLRYRVIRTDEAAAVVRIRRRGAAREAVLAEVFSPTASATRALLRRIRRSAGADYLLTLAGAPHTTPWLAPLPRLGPRLTVRDLADSAPTLDQFRFALGDIELF